jgi:hypothetical protein
MHILSNHNQRANNNALPLFKESSSPPTHYFFQKLPDTQLEILLKDLEQTDDEDDKHKILCRTCRYQITTREKKRAVNGQHQHIFNNPAGIFYEIGCFSAANGCVNHGTPTIEHTWFTGFAWRYALCTNCLTHLGWFFQSGDDSFYGLILKNLEETV